MPGRGRVVAAVFKREFFSYFSSPTGYVFITLFVFLSAVAAFWQEQFFLNNLANLEQLNRYFPYLLVFLCPAITMGLWAEERKQGTEELLLTLPAANWELLIGKYLAALGAYSVALAFSLSHLVVLWWLGNPDAGLMFSTYLGYWLMGAALLPLGLLASQLTDNLTVAFILGSLFCAIPVFLEHAGTLLTGHAARVAERLSVVSQFHDLSDGIVTLGAVVYFGALAAAGLYWNILLVGRRRWPKRKGERRLEPHYAMRSFCALLIAAAGATLASTTGLRADVTSEQIHSLSPATRTLIQSIDPSRPVFIQAYFSPEVPRSYIAVRRNLVSFLREFEAEGKGRVLPHIVETLKYTPEAREARERYNIEPHRVSLAEEDSTTNNEIFLALVFTCGPREFVIPFFDRGLPVEYELMRSIRVVSGARRRKVGVLQTGAKLFGGFDFESRKETQDWDIIGELKKQYDVAQVSPDSDYPQDLDALVAVEPTSLTQPQVDRLTAYVKTGKPVLVLLDPMPAFNLTMSPEYSRVAANTEGPVPTPVLPNVKALLASLGVEWPMDRVVWDTNNPHPQLSTVPPEIIFISRTGGASQPFQEKDEVTSGLQEVVLLFAGELKPQAEKGLKFVPLLETGKTSGVLRWTDLVSPSMFGLQMTPNPPRTETKDVYTVAARITGKTNAIVVADADFIGSQFFDLRRRGVENLNFDNVTFVLNAVDELAGDPSFIALRKRRPRLRTLEAVEARTRVYEQKQKEETQLAQATADKRLKEAQARLDLGVRQVEMRPDLDEQTKRIMISNLQTAENRRLEVARANIDDEREREIEDARASMESSVRGIQNTIKLMAVSLPPIPAFLLFLFVSLRKLRRERIGVSAERLVRDKAA